MTLNKMINEKPALKSHLCGGMGCKSMAIKARGLLFLSMTLLSISACSEPGPVGNAAEGKSKSAICGQCHGQNGISIIPIYPNLAGQKQGYMELQLQAFRAGVRINAAMTPHARKLTDQDIVDLSAYYASLDGNGLGRRVTNDSGNQKDIKTN